MLILGHRSMNNGHTDELTLNMQAEKRKSLLM
jgi:hypothetical protein